MKYIITTTLILAFLLAGCSTYKPPKEYNFEKQQNYNKSFDDVWSAVIDYFGTTNIPIDNMEKASGFIKASISGNDPSTDMPEYFDCGEMPGMIYIKNYNANFNIVVKEKEGTEVTINTFVNIDGQFYDQVSGARYNVECKSTGGLEKAIFEYIKNN